MRTTLFTDACGLIEERGHIRNGNDAIHQRAQDLALRVQLARCVFKRSVDHVASNGRHAEPLCVRLSLQQCGYFRRHAYADLDVVGCPRASIECSHAKQFTTHMETQRTFRNRHGEAATPDRPPVGRSPVCRRLVDAPPPLDDAERFAAHLATEFPAVFLFLWDPSLDATNWRAEQAIRPAVVIRKVCGGNRTRHGADTQQVLASVVRTARQRNLDLPPLIAAMLRAAEPVVPELLGLPPPPP